MSEDCKFYDKEWGNCKICKEIQAPKPCLTMSDIQCKDLNCYYKQLQQAQKENERLKQQMSKFRTAYVVSELDNINNNPPHAPQKML